MAAKARIRLLSAAGAMALVSGLAQFAVGGTATDDRRWPAAPAAAATAPAAEPAKAEAVEAEAVEAAAQSVAAPARLASSCLVATCARAAVAYRTPQRFQVTATAPKALRRDTIASFPSVFTHGARVWVSYSRSHDLPHLTQLFTSYYSADGGKTFRWHSNTLSVENAVYGPRGFVAINERANTYPNRMSAVIRGSRGPAWTPFYAILNFRTRPQPGSGATFSHGIVRSGSTLLAPYYGRFTGDTPGARSTRVEVAASADGGLTWRTRGTALRPVRQRDGTVIAYNEASVMRLGSGALMLVARSEVFDVKGNRRSFRPLVYTISTNDGRTWTAPRMLAVDGAAARYAARPSVLLLPNGMYVLAAGRPDNVLAFARRTNKDGSPVFSGRLLGYQNYPKSHGIYRFGGSSGYAAIAPLGTHRLIAVFDNCAATWGCRKPKSKFTMDGVSRITMRFVTVLPLR